MTTEENIKQMLTELINESKTTEPPKMPSFLNDPRLEDAFKSPECNEEGYALRELPAVWDHFSYGKKKNGVKIIAPKSATTVTSLYSRYLDEPALLWNALEDEVYIYVPGQSNSAMAFKGSAWPCAKKLKAEYQDTSLDQIYIEGWLTGDDNEHIEGQQYKLGDHYHISLTMDFSESDDPLMKEINDIAIIMNGGEPDIITLDGTVIYENDEVNVVKVKKRYVEFDFWVMSYSCICEIIPDFKEKYPEGGKTGLEEYMIIDKHGSHLYEIDPDSGEAHLI